jgi:hypothetical protein
MVDVVHVLFVISMSRFVVLVSLHQPWELEQLNVVEWQFLEYQKLTGSSLSV